MAWGDFKIVVSGKEKNQKGKKNQEVTNFVEMTLRNPTRVACEID